MFVSRKSSTPRARLQLEALENRTVPSSIDGVSTLGDAPASDEFVMDTTVVDVQYSPSGAVGATGDVVVLSGSSGSSDGAWALVYDTAVDEITDLQASDTYFADLTE